MTGFNGDVLFDHAKVTFDGHTIGGVPSETSTVRFDVIDRDDELLGVLQVDRQQPPTLKWDRQADVPRILDGVHVLPRPDVVPPGTIWAGDVDADRHEVRVVWCDLHGETDVGVFVWRSGEMTETPDGTVTLAGGVLYDQTFWLRDETPQTFAVGPGNLTTSLRGAITALLGAAGVPPHRVTLPTEDFVLGKPLAWPAGLRRDLILSDLLRKGGWVGWFDGSGRFRCRRTPVPQMDPPDVTYAAGQTSTVLRGTASVGFDMLPRHNAWKVLSVDPDTDPVVAFWQLPASAAGSSAQVGRTRTRVIEEAGLTQVEADRRVIEAARTEWRRETVVSFTSTTNPNHDGHCLVEFDGQVWLEDAWELPLVAGGQMTHRMSRTEGLL